MPRCHRSVSSDLLGKNSDATGPFVRTRSENMAKIARNVVKSPKFQLSYKIDAPDGAEKDAVSDFGQQVEMPLFLCMCIGKR